MTSDRVPSSMSGATASREILRPSQQPPSSANGRFRTTAPAFGRAWAGPAVTVLPVVPEAMAVVPAMVAVPEVPEVAEAVEAVEAEVVVAAEDEST